MHAITYKEHAAFAWPACELLPTAWGTLLSVSVFPVEIRRNFAWHFFCFYVRRLQEGAQMAERDDKSLRCRARAMKFRVEDLEVV